jgi:hypothetical protein
MNHATTQEKTQEMRSNNMQKKHPLGHDLLLRRGGSGVCPGSACGDGMLIAWAVDVAPMPRSVRVLHR